MSDSREWSDAGYVDWPHFVRIDCDWSADGLWNERGAMFDLDSFPVSEDVRTALRQWQQAFGASKPWEEPTALETEIYRNTAEAIAREIKRQLPKCVVVALRNRIRDDLTLGETVSYPGEPIDDQTVERWFVTWKRLFLNGDFAA